MPLTILSCCKIGEYKLPACYIIVTKMLQESETQTCLQVSQRAQNISQNAKCYKRAKRKPVCRFHSERRTFRRMQNVTRERNANLFAGFTASAEHFAEGKILQTGIGSRQKTTDARH